MDLHKILSSILSDKKGNIIFRCFGLEHIIFIILFIIIGVLLCLYLKNKDCLKRKNIIDKIINIAFITYIIDFFLMPFAYGEIDIEKLPFHVCTAMCVMCFWSRYNSFLGKYKLQFAMLGFLSNLVYLLYPAGVMWHAVHPISYRVIQTLSFHGIMAIYGFLVIVYEREDFAWKRCYRDLCVIATMTAWAFVGNLFYNNELRIYNWFFVVQDPFNILPKSCALYIMPFLNIILFMMVELVVYLVFLKTRRQIKR